MPEPGEVGFGAESAIDQVIGQSRQLAESARSLVDSARSGGFGFHPEAADLMIAALNQSVLDLEGMRGNLASVSQAPKLGQTPGAVVVAPFTQKVATDERGVRQAVADLRQTLTDMITAYTEAKKNYDASDSISAQRMRGLPREPA